MPKTFVIETRAVPVSLGHSEFCASEITPPTFAVERVLRDALTHPALADPRWFVSTLLASCMAPSRSASEIEVLTEPDRARLRRGLVDACEERARWQALYGSHLSADERLLALMVWRHRRQIAEVDGIVAKIAARRADLASAVERISEGMVSRHVVADLVRTSLTLTTQAQQAATLSKNILQPYSALSASLGLERLGFLDTVRALETSRKMTAQLHLGMGVDSTRGPLGAGQGSWMKALGSTKADSGVLAASRALIDTSNLGAHYASLFSSSAPSILTLVEPFGRQVQLTQEVLREYEEADQFMQTWERDALWLLFLHVGVGAARPLARLSRSEVEAVVLLALEAICSDGKYIPAIREAVAAAPYVTPSQRTHLDHMLEHAEQGEYVKASGSLYPGLEGAYREAAYSTAVVTRPKGTKRALGFATVVKRMDLPSEVQTFMVRAIFDGTGHTIRHGIAEGVERRQVLLGVAALAAWLELFADDRALDLLGTYLTATLPRAIEQRQPLKLALAAGS